MSGLEQFTSISFLTMLVIRFVTVAHLEIQSFSLSVFSTFISLKSKQRLLQVSDSLDRKAMKSSFCLKLLASISFKILSEKSELDISNYNYIIIFSRAREFKNQSRIMIHKIIFA